MDVIYGIDNPLFLDNMHDREYLLKTLLPWLLKYKVNIRKANRLNEPVYPYLRRFTSNQSLIDIIAQHFFKNTPTFFALSYFGLYLDYCYPKGGTGVLAEKMTDFIHTSGGEVRAQIAVTGVDALNNRIQTADGTILRYKKLIWAADQKSLYSSLTSLDSPNIKKQHLLTEQGSGGDSILALFMGVGLDYGYFESRCGPHSFYTPSTGGLSSLAGWKEAAAHGKDELYTWISRYLELTTYEISCPALRDAALAPEGKTGVIVSTLFDYNLVRHISDSGGYQDFKNYCTEKITEVLNLTVFPGISENTEFVLCSTPMTIERETGNAQGAITGWAFTNTEMPAENRFQKIANSIKTPIKDVYQCGQWTFSPSGLPVSILTGKLAADAIHKTLKGSAK
jgi:phytoene dehydrogenase-like protein